MGRFISKLHSNEKWRKCISWNTWRNSWIKFENEKLKVQEYKYERETELKIENGILKGINRGEWGGKLTFQPNDKNRKEIEIKTGNVKFIFKYNEKIYFIEGIAHLSINEGFLYELTFENNKFNYKKTKCST